MSRYVIKFSKEGYIKFISHLDMLRLFKRSFKRAGIKLQYSQGFNPHPKMSFAQPLSLGYTSSCEYLEFETMESHSTEEIRRLLESMMPEGVEIIKCEELAAEGKALAALTEEASYEIRIPVKDITKLKNPSTLAEDYLSRESITIKKLQKKSRKEIEINIRPMIKSLKSIVDNNNIMLNARLSAGSTENLSPEILLSTFCKFADIDYDRADIQLNRTGIYFIDEFLKI
jgi:Uncharacterized protein conserved in bacteria